MNINKFVYQTLKPHERVIAVIEAMARKDDVEIKHLVETCPKKTYQAADHEYEDKLQQIMMTNLYIECELRGYMIGALILAQTEDPCRFMCLLEKSKELQSSWHSMLDKMGVNPENLHKAQDLKHPGMDHFLSIR